MKRRSECHCICHTSGVDVRHVVPCCYYGEGDEILDLGNSILIRNLESKSAFEELQEIDKMIADNLKDSDEE